MTHAWHDTYHHASTPAHHFDPRAKLLVALHFVGFVLLTPHVSLHKGAAYAVFLVFAAALCRVPISHFIRRIGSLVPFLLLMGLSAWLSSISREQVEQILGKALLSIGAMTVLAASVPFPDMLRALQELRMPRTFILFLAFLYRYAAVLGRESLKLERGWKARYFGRMQSNPWRELGHILSALFIRSYERAERVYAAMLARGFSLSGPAPRHPSGVGAAGTGRQRRSVPALRVLHFRRWDALLMGVAGLLLSVIRWGRF